MEKRDKRVHAIIHCASITAGGIGGGLAQLPGADMPVLMSLQTAMILAIAHVHGSEVTRSRAKTLLLTLPAGYGGRSLTQVLAGCIPGYGNAIKVGTAIAITEAVGWAADAFFRQEATAGKQSDIENDDPQPV